MKILLKKQNILRQHFTLLRIPLLIFFILMGYLSFHSTLLAQTNKPVTPGTFASLPTRISSTHISSAATVTGLQQYYSSTGQYTLSADGIGSLSSSMNIRVNKPNAQATVQKAILISSVTFGTIDNGCVTIAGVPVNWDGTAAGAVTTYDFNNYWADVTSIVASTINAFPAGVSTLPITECSTGNIEGEALLVVFNDPSASEKTIIVLLGAENPQGDNFSVTLAKPIDPNAPGALLDMGLGIGFSYQLNGTNQASQVSVNNQRLSSSAGGEDDGDDANGALLTVGGIGDSDDNPVDPFANPTNPRSDDELYSILPFITNTITSLTVNTINPSLDDNIFLAYFVTSGAAVVGEGILLSQTSDSGYVGDNHTVEATLVDDSGHAITNRLVTFTVTSGPNAGNTFSAKTDASGNVSYTYTGTGGSGTDTIQACFKNSQNQTSCSNTLSFTWIAVTTGRAPYFDYTVTPANGVTLSKHTGEAIMFTVKALDMDSGDVVTLTAAGIPAGATTMPMLPTTGNPVSTKFMWTPMAGDAGTYPIHFTATDKSGKTTTTTVIVQVTSVSCDSSFRPFVYAYPAITVANQEYHTIYKGYGPQSVALAAIPRGGSGKYGKYKFMWDNGSTLPVRIVSPNVTTRYEVDITDGNGCMAHTAITIHVVDVRCGNNNNKVKLCFGSKTLCVDSSAVDALIKGGAKLGSCDMMSSIASATSATAASTAAIKVQPTGAFTVYPNPARNTINLKWNITVAPDAKINIMDLQGRVLISQVAANAAQTIDISKLSGGVYMAQLSSGGRQLAISRFTVSK